MDTRLATLVEQARTYSAFADHQRHLYTSPDLDAVVQAARQALTADGAAAATVFDDLSGERTEVGSDETSAAVRSRLGRVAGDDQRQGPGRPKLGVVSREISLLPRHWEWLEAHSGGASA